MEFRRVLFRLIDVDDQKREEGRGREREYKIRKIIQKVPAPPWSSAPDAQMTAVNQRVLEDYFGWRFDDLQHRGWVDLLHPDDVAETTNAFAHAIQSGTSYQATHRLRRAEGEYRWHQSCSEPLRDCQGNILQWYGLTVDIDEAKKAEDRLRRSEAHLAEAHRLSHTGASVYNATALLYWSEEMFRIMGFDPRDGLPGREAMWQRIHPDDRNQLRANVELAKSGKGGFSSECRIVLPDGTVKYIESIREPVFSANGELVEVLATHVDVTERKRAADSLRESEAKFRDYAETASDWFWETGPDFKFTLLTENAFGSRSADRIGTTCWDHAVDLETEPEKWRFVRAMLDSRNPFRDFVYCTVSGDGSPIYVRASGKPVFDGSGEFLGYRGTGSDVTAIVRAQEAVRAGTEALRRSEAYLAEAQRLSHTGTWVLNPITMQYLYWSDECYRIWGFDPLQGLPSREALWQRIDDRGRVWSEVQEALRHKRDYSGEFKIVLPDGTAKWLAATCHHLFSPDGQLVEVIGTNVDVTERKRVEDRLRVQHTVAQVLAEAVTIEEATPRILRAVGECLGWDVGALWRVDREVGALRCIELWHKGSIEVPEFERVSREFTFVSGSGLPGRVWSSLEPEYVPDVVRDRNFPRGPIAEREGLNTALAVPILLRGEALGVIEFFSREIRQPDQELLNVLATIGSQIGQFIERKRGEEALRESEAKIRRLVDANIIGIFIWDFEGQVLEANEAFLNILGYDHEDLAAGRIRWTDLTPPEWRDRDTRLIQEHKRTGALQPFEKEYFRKDGSRVPVLMGVATFEEGGTQGVAFVLDLTERRRAEEALRRNEAELIEAKRELQQTIDIIPMQVVRYSSDFRRDFVNSAWKRFTGVSDEVGLGTKWLTTVHPDDLAIAEKGWRDATLTNGEPVHAELRLRRADGQYRWFVVYRVALRDENGKVIKWYSTGHDIEERKRAEDALREREAQLAEARRDLHATIDNTPALVASLWPNGERDFVNLAWQRFTGISQEEARGTTQMMHLHPAHRGLGARDWQRCLETGEPFEQEEQLLRVDGQYRWHSVRRVPARDENGKVIKWYGIGFDIEERKHAEEALRESEGKFRDYAETASDWFWETDPDYKFTLLTENAFGSDPADRIGTPWWDHALDLEMEPEKWRLLQATLDSRKPFRDFVYCAACGDGTQMYVRASGKPIFDANA